MGGAAGRVGMPTNAQGTPGAQAGLGQGQMPQGLQDVMARFQSGQMPAGLPQQSMIQRAAFNPGQFYNAGSTGYAAWRAPQNFAPQVTPQMPSQAAASAAQPTEIEKLRSELDALRAYQNRSNEGR